MLGLREEFPGPEGGFFLSFLSTNDDLLAPTVTRTANATAAEEVIHSVSRRIFAASCTERGACTKNQEYLCLILAFIYLKAKFVEISSRHIFIHLFVHSFIVLYTFLDSMKSAIHGGGG